MSDSGHELRDNNEKIVKLMSLLKKERDEINYLIEKQEQEKTSIETEIEKLTFKLSLLKKSLNQRIQTRSNYDRTIKKIEETYSGLVEESEKLLFALNKEVHQLEQIMDKKTGTPEEQQSNGGAGEKRTSGELSNSSSDESIEIPELKHHSSDLNTGASQPFKDLHNSKQSMAEKLNKIDVAPIKMTRMSDDVELQSFREAYSRTHNPQSLTDNASPQQQHPHVHRQGSQSRRRRNQD